MSIRNTEEKTRYIGYVRISTRTQHEDRQIYSLEEFGVTKEHLYIDKMSGKDFDRPAYKRMVRSLRPGDVLVLSSIDRLGRNYDEIIEQWRLLTKEKRTHVVILDMPLLDTRRSSEELIDTFVADIVLQIMSYVAQNEREMMRQRQREGIEAAKRKGVRFGRPRVEVTPQFDGIYAEWKNGQVSMRKAAAQLGIAVNTFRRWVQERPS